MPEFKGALKNLIIRGGQKLSSKIISIFLQIQKALSCRLYRAPASAEGSQSSPEVQTFQYTEMRKMARGLILIWCLCLIFLADCRSYRGREVEDEVDQELAKRQFNDYGHMRFGKRGGVTEDKFEDYGYMRFGRRQP